MSEGTLTETRIKSLLDDLNSCSQQCGFEAFVVTRILDAIYESARTGKPVYLDE